MYVWQNPDWPTWRYQLPESSTFGKSEVTLLPRNKIVVGRH